jgi:hypothetical protein
MSIQLFKLIQLLEKLKIQTLCLTSSDRASLLTKSNVHLHTFRYIPIMEASKLCSIGKVVGNNQLI